MARKFGMSALDLKASAIIIAGDIGPNTKKVLSYLSRLEKPIYTVLGNDDSPMDAYILEDTRYVLNIDAECIDIGPLNIIGISSGSGYGMGPPDEKMIKRKLEEAFAKTFKPTILASHLPPYGVLDLATRHSERGKHIGSKALKKMIEQNHPILCICGHVHKEGGKRAMLEGTEVINVAALENDETSKNQSRRFAIIDIDQKKRCTCTFDYLIDSNLPLEKFIQRYV